MVFDICFTAQRRGGEEGRLWCLIYVSQHRGGVEKSGR